MFRLWASLWQKRSREVSGSSQVPHVILDEAFNHPMPWLLLVKRTAVGDSFLQLKKIVKLQNIQYHLDFSSQAYRVMVRAVSWGELEADHPSLSWVPFAHHCSSTFSQLRTELLNSRKLQWRTSDINSLSWPKSVAYFTLLKALTSF